MIYIIYILIDKFKMACQTEGIYLIQIKDIVITNNNIYKIGRSHNIITRIKKYPKGSSAIVLLECCNSVQCEKDLLSIFKQKFTQNKYYGLEYFEGDKIDMMEVICKEVKKYNDIEKEKLDAVKKIKEIEKIEIDSKTEDKKDIIKELIIEESIIEEEPNKLQKENDKHKLDINEKELIKENNKLNLINIANMKNKDCTTCSKCNTEFKYHSYLVRHIKTAVKCKKINKKEDIKCIKCNKIFTKNSSLVFHNNNSKCGLSKNGIIKDIKTIIKKKEKEINPESEILNIKKQKIKLLETYLLTLI